MVALGVGRFLMSEVPLYEYSINSISRLETHPFVAVLGVVCSVWGFGVWGLGSSGAGCSV